MSNHDDPYLNAFLICKAFNLDEETGNFSILNIAHRIAAEIPTDILPEQGVIELNKTIILLLNIEGPSIADILRVTVTTPDGEIKDVAKGRIRIPGVGQPHRVPIGFKDALALPGVYMFRAYFGDRELGKLSFR